MRSFELFKGSTKPLSNELFCSMSSDVVDAHNRLEEKQKLEHILKLKSTDEPHVTTGGMIEVYDSTLIEKKGKCSTPKIVLAVDQNARTAILPPTSGKRATVAFEDTRMSLPKQSLQEPRN